jgi:hypothetical protein
MDMKGEGNMAIKEIAIGFSRTINLGNYESARVEALVTWEVEENKNKTWDQQINDLQDELALLLKQTWLAQNDKFKSKAK